MGSRLEIVRMDRADDRAWRYMPRALDRMAKFCGTMDSETDPVELVEMIQTWFITSNPHLGLWVGVLDGVVVGHLLATPEPIGYTRQWRYVLVRQAEVDDCVDAQNEAKQVFEAVVEWTRMLQLTRIMILTHKSEQAMARRWGFVPQKSWMRYDLNGRG